MARWVPAALLLAVVPSAFAQDYLADMPRYDRFSKLVREYSAAMPRDGALSVTWSDDSKHFTYNRSGKAYRYEVTSRKAVEIPASEAPAPVPPRRRRSQAVVAGQAPERGRQFAVATSPDGKYKAETKDRNVVITTADGKDPVAVTTSGSVASRTKFGVASWVYGEELGVREAMWWSQDSTMLAYYGFDEGAAKDYYLAYSQASFQDSLDVEAYPKAGAPNPVVSLFVYNREHRTTVAIDVKSGDPALAEYVYAVRWSPDGKSLLFNRANRKQNWLQLCAADPTTGKVRVVIEEHQPQSWVDPNPTCQFLADGKHFVWATEASGYANLVLASLEGGEPKPITRGKVDVLSVIKVDEVRKMVYYMAAGPENPYFRQFHRVGLDGKRDEILTDIKLDHSVAAAPDGNNFVDVAQSPDRAPETRLLDSRGRLIDTVATSDLSKAQALNLKPTEIFSCPAADGQTTIYGTISYPSDFDPTKKYPVLLDVYGGPDSGGINPGYRIPSPVTELGFLVVSVAGRGTTGRGKAFKDAVYGKLGIVEIDDQAAGVRSLGSRPYVDLKRVGVWGTSYGGYATLMLMLRHPELFSVGCASSSVTDWRNYDSIYTERYMGLPDAADNLAGYDAGSAVKLAKNLRGKLLLYFGSADNNVHPSNTYQFVQALDQANRRYDMQVGTDLGHTQVNSSRIWEYFVTHLILRPAKDPIAQVFSPRARSSAR